MQHRCTISQVGTRPQGTLAVLAAILCICISTVATNVSAQETSEELLLTQTITPRGLNQDPRAHMPTAQEQIRRSQTRQQNTFSSRQSVQDAERRRRMEDLNTRTSPNRDCTGNGADCRK